jgi:integrase
VPSINLTDRFLAGNPDPTNYFDTTTKGLTLRVTAGGGKLWSFVYRVKGGKPQWITLGSYPTLRLAKAREAAGALRYAVDVEKRDPVAERKAAEAAAKVPAAPVAPVLTVRTYAKAFITFQKGRKKTWLYDEQKIARHILPAWGDLPLESITRKMVAALLTDIAAKGLTTGVNRIQAIISRMFVVAVSDGHIEHNPAARIERRFDENARTRTLSEAEIRTLYAELQARPGEAADATWLRLILGQRGEETAGMVWSELDLTARVWKLNAVRTKNGQEHWVWLPDMAITILRHQREITSPKEPRVFPELHQFKSVEEKELYTVSAMFPDFDWRDLRRTFSTGLGDLGFDDGVIDRLLNHKAATVGRKHYNHAKYLPEKQVALAAWDRELTRILKNEPKTARVIPMGAR